MYYSARKCKQSAVMIAIEKYGMNSKEHLHALHREKLRQARKDKKKDYVNSGGISYNKFFLGPQP